jgi:hypothetical protein
MDQQGDHSKIAPGASQSRALADVDVDESSQSADDFLASAEHPTYQRPYTELSFVPMIELLEFLEAHEFTCYIVSGGGSDFMRPVSDSMYRIPADPVAGSSPGLHFVADDSGSRIMRTASLDIFDDGPMKPVQIWERIGRRPILAAGNANGDVPMLQFATDQPGESLALFVHHDDDTREVAYDAGADVVIEQAERVLTNTAVERLLDKEASLGADLKFEDIIEEVAGVHPKVMETGDMEAGARSCGMVAGLINDVPSVQELITASWPRPTSINEQLRSFL